MVHHVYLFHNCCAKKKKPDGGEENNRKQNSGSRRETKGSSSFQVAEGDVRFIPSPDLRSAPWEDRVALSLSLMK